MPSRRQLIQQSLALGGAALVATAARAEAAGSNSKPVAKRSFHEMQQRLQQPRIIASSGGVLDTHIRVVRASNEVGGQPLPAARTFDHGLTGATLKVKPGDQLRVKLSNDLDASTTLDTASCSHHDMAACQDNINLHTHGMHVSPSGNEDNVLIDIPPGESFQYQINIPKDHYAGIAWYHPHRHGTVSKQVMEGMSGALIVEGGLDEVPEIRAARDQILVMQQLVIPSDNFGNILPITLNGQLQPKIDAMPGELLRWRFVHATTIDYIEVALLDSDDNKIPLHVIAEDGIALGRIDRKDSHFMSPGNRAEILVKANKPGHYRLVKLAQKKGLRDFPDAGQTLAHVYISGSQQNMPLPAEKDLVEHAPFAPITDQELTGRQPDLEFRGTQGAVYIDGKSFAPGRIDRTMHLGDVEEWTLRSATGSHPFHIHVNPFQVVKINGVPVEKPLWRDVVLVKAEWQHGVTIRTRYQRFTGVTVLHCHNLVHEDKGMMQLIEILPARNKSNA